MRKIPYIRDGTPDQPKRKRGASASTTMANRTTSHRLLAGELAGDLQA